MVGRRQTMETNSENIISNVKESLGIYDDDESFDKEILLHISGALAKLRQLGAGAVLPNVTVSTTWDDVKDPLQEKGNASFDLVKQFVFVYVKMIFDPPAPSTLGTYTSVSNELAWRITVAYSEK